MVCIYHGKCLDGFTGAWIVDKANRVDHFIEGRYGVPIDLKLMQDEEVIFVDFSVKREEMIAIAEVAESVLVLDHHKTAEQELVDLPDNVKVVFDMKRSGAMIAWDYYFPSNGCPLLVKLVQDRDLWLFEHRSTKAITAYMFTLPQAFAEWDYLADNILEGEAIGNILLEKQEKDCKDLISGLTFEATFQGYTVNVTNCSWLHASDIGNMTVGENKLSMTFFIDQKGHYKYSLRAKDGIDTSELAKIYGGGGHPNASGFSLAYPVWETKHD